MKTIFSAINTSKITIVASLLSIVAYILHIVMNRQSTMSGVPVIKFFGVSADVVMVLFWGILFSSILPQRYRYFAISILSLASLIIFTLWYFALVDLESAEILGISSSISRANGWLGNPRPITKLLYLCFVSNIVILVVSSRKILLLLKRRKAVFPETTCRESEHTKSHFIRLVFGWFGFILFMWYLIEFEFSPPRPSGAFDLPISPDWAKAIVPSFLAAVLSLSRKFAIRCINIALYLMLLWRFMEWHLRTRQCDVVVLSGHKLADPNYYSSMGFMYATWQSNLALIVFIVGFLWTLATVLIVENCKQRTENPQTAPSSDRIS